MGCQGCQSQGQGCQGQGCQGQGQDQDYSLLGVLRMLYIDLGIWMGIWNWLDWVMWLIYGGGAMVAYDTGWIRVMGLIDGDMSWGRATGSGDGIDLWGRAMGSSTPAGSGRWDWFMGACHRGARHWLDRVTALIHGGTRHWLDQGAGIDSWGHAMGVRDPG